MARQTNSYVIPVADLSLAQREAMRQEVNGLLIQQAMSLNIALDQRNIILRDTLPDTDLGLGAAGGWQIPGAGVAGTEQQYFTVALPVNRCIAFYGFATNQANPAIQRARFVIGALAGFGEIRAQVQLEKMYNLLEPRVYLSESIMFLRQETLGLLVTPLAAFAAASQQLEPLARTVEPRGLIVSGSSV